MSYVSIEDLKTTLSMTGETFADDDILQALAAATEQVNSSTARVFERDTEPSTKVYVAARERWLLVDDFFVEDGDAPILVEWDEHGNDHWVAFEPQAFFLGPPDAGATSPYSEIRLRPDTYSWCPGQSYVRVTAIWGWPEIPASVKEATSIMAQRYLKRKREAPFGIAGMGTEGMPVRITGTDPDVRTLLGPYARSARLS